MTPKISFFTAVVGAALVFAVPAFGDAWGALRDGQKYMGTGVRDVGPRAPQSS